MLSMIDNPLDTTEMKGQIVEMNKNSQSSLNLEDKVMSWIMPEVYVSPAHKNRKPEIAKQTFNF